MAENNLKYQSSYWERQTFLPPIDVLIIGSGIVGLNAALYLKEQQADLRVAIAERGPLPIGASTRNAGFACFGSMTELLDDLRHLPEDQVWGLVERRWRGLQSLRERLGDTQLRFHNWGGYELFMPAERNSFRECLEQIDYFNQQLRPIIGQSSVFQDASDRIDSFGFKGVEHLILNTAESQLDTGQMMLGLLRKAQEAGVTIWNGLSIEAIEPTSQGVEVQTSFGWTMNCQHLIVATNGFAQQLLPELEVRPARNQVLVTKPLSQLKLQGCFHYDRGYYYFRNIDGRILLGGGRNLAPEAETTTDFGQTDLIQQRLKELLHQQIEPKAEIDYWWSGILGIGQSKEPILRKLHERVTVAVRLGGMGVAIGSLLGEEAGKKVLGGLS